METPKLDRQQYRQQLQQAIEQTLQQVADAVDEAPDGRIIRDSEEKARDALDAFRRLAYQTAIQMKVDAAEAAFPPSGQRSKKTDAE